MDASGSRPGYQSTGRQVRGRSLHDVLHDPGTGIAQQAVIPLDPSRVALIARAILNALTTGAVHGYITPHTIVLTDDGNALLVRDRVAPGATPANDLFALGMALFEAVEGYAPHPAEALPAMQRAGVLAPVIEALTRQDPGQRPDAAAALALLKEVTAPPSPDAIETRTLPQVPAADSADTSVLPRVAATPTPTAVVPAVGPVGAVETGRPGGSGGPGGPGGPGSPPASAASVGSAASATSADYSASGYAAYDDYPQANRRALLIGGAFAAVVVVAGVTLGVTRPWHRTDTSSSTVPGVPTATSVPATPAAAAPSTSASATPSATTSTPSPTLSPTPTTTTTSAPAVSNPTALVSMSLCLSAAADGGGVHSGATVSAGNCQGSPNQTWQIHNDGTIHSVADQSLCLDAAAPNGKVSNGAQVSAWSCHGGPNQDWVWNANGTVSPVADTGLCLDAAGPVPIKAGANVTAWPCNGGPNEMWAPQQ
ncbi:hypothetical protein ABH926_005698 [Catenulispora sp. GP43]|uniref:ricin-type beta-trefoil lectin domain protein n=1 Tax=Catenulispora sp. GP43 TaxID=3156263 RepID=UPI0035156820